jgi:ABC-2 type transport system ATP-binding protein
MTARGQDLKGMKQRASALLPRCWVTLTFDLDEPTSGLDPRGMSEVRDIIKSLKGKNRLIFMSSHLLNEVSEVCDEVAMIDHGKLIIYDTIANVTAKVSGGATTIEVGLLRPLDDSVLTSTVAKLSGVVSAEKRNDHAFVLRVSGGLDIQETLLSELVKLNIGLVSFSSFNGAGRCIS